MRHLLSQAQMSCAFAKIFLAGVPADVTPGLVKSEARQEMGLQRASHPPHQRHIMNDKYIRDGTGKIIGYPDGQHIKDRTGRILGKYTASDDYTRDRIGKIIGKGDQRMRLLK
jgi:hypothetical protein